jgi:2-amino-4-hydroxy-6-hydroxymethyldihydropteridine diphosphokinase
MNQRQHSIIISLASNYDQQGNLAKAREQLKVLLSDIQFTKELWTHPVNNHRQEPYLNQLCQATTNLGANLLSEVLKELEKRLGRTHNEEGIVTIDLDLMAYDGQRYHLKDWDRSYIKELISEL